MAHDPELVDHGTEACKPLELAREDGVIRARVVEFAHERIPVLEVRMGMRSVLFETAYRDGLSSR